jgi:DNA-binding IclR family transcriptional regulator
LPLIVETSGNDSITRPYAANDGEPAAGVRTVAVPVLDRAGRVRFALAVRATPEVIAGEKIPWAISQARACAGAIQVHRLLPEERPGQDEPA